MRRWRWLILAGVLLWAGPGALADDLQSTHYQINESFVGGGGLTGESSPNYNVAETIGDVAVGNSTSSNYQVNAGYTTTSDPALTFIVDSANINFGHLSTSTTAHGTATFHVIDYTSFGYNVAVIGTPPTNGSYTLDGMTSTGPSQVGTEQFGINLRANTSPFAQGADPLGGFGTWGTGYGTVNQYRYNDGEVIATAPKSSGQTDYTISYIVNISSTTGGGTYTGNPYSGAEELVCTGTY